MPTTDTSQTFDTFQHSFTQLLSSSWTEEKHSLNPFLMYKNLLHCWLGCRKYQIECLQLSLYCVQDTFQILGTFTCFVQDTSQIFDTFDCLHLHCVSNTSEILVFVVNLCTGRFWNTWHLQLFADRERRSHWLEGPQMTPHKDHGH